MLLSQRTILISGAGGGLGGTAALALAKQGAELILLDKSIPKLEAVYDAIVAQGGPEPVMYPMDLAGATEDHYQELADAVIQRYGALHGLLHSAVEFSAFTPISSHKALDWLQAMHINVNAAFFLTRALLPVLLVSDDASLVFTSDSSAQHTPAYAGAYGVSKIALEGLSRILAEEYAAGQRLRVNTLLPGAIDSPLRKKAYPAEDKSSIPTMDSLAAIYVHLFSAASVGMTGQIIDAQTFKF